MNIRELIKDLLLKHNVVVLPGIGGFVSEYEEAKVNPKDNILSPPHKKIKFDTKLIKDENSLIENHLINTFKLSKTEAAQKTNQFLEELNEEISLGAAVKILGIGYLKKDDKQGIILEPKLEKNLLLDSFGFEPVSQKSYDKPSMTPKPNVPKVNETKVDVKMQKEWLVLKPYFIIPAVAILLILLLIIFTDIEKTISNINAKKIFAGKEKNKTESVENANQTELGKSLDAQTDPSVALQIEGENKTSDEDRYANCTEFIIIAGSFNQFKNAEELRQQLLTKGYEPEIILSEEKKYRVALKSFDNRQIALKEFEVLKEKEKELNIWLLSI